MHILVPQPTNSHGDDAGPHGAGRWVMSDGYLHRQGTALYGRHTELGGSTVFVVNPNRPAHYPQTNKTSLLRLLTANATLRNGLGKEHSSLEFLAKPKNIYSDIQGR